VATTLPRATAAVVNFISVTDHFQALSQGVVDSADLIYFASLIAFGLYLSLTIVAAQRWSGD
jgi:ABC-2 type transport system permease protein